MVKSFHVMKYSFIILIAGIQLQISPGKRDEFFTIEKNSLFLVDVGNVVRLLSISSTTQHTEQARQFNGIKAENIDMIFLQVWQFV